MPRRSRSSRFWPSWVKTAFSLPFSWNCTGFFAMALSPFPGQKALQVDADDLPPIPGGGKRVSPRLNAVRGGCSGLFDKALVEVTAFKHPLDSRCSQGPGAHGAIGDAGVANASAELGQMRCNRQQCDAVWSHPAYLHEAKSGGLARSCHSDRAHDRAVIALPVAQELLDLDPAPALADKFDAAAQGPQRQ